MTINTRKAEGKNFSTQEKKKKKHWKNNNKYRCKNYRFVRKSHKISIETGT